MAVTVAAMFGTFSCGWRDEQFKSSVAPDQARFKPGDKLLGSPACIHHHAQYPDHIEDPRDGSLIERVDVKPATDEVGDNVCLEIGERQDEVGPECEDLVDIRRSEGAYPGLFAASLRRTHNVAGDPDDAILLAKQVGGSRRSLR
jgi:hypothetical protein